MPFHFSVRKRHKLSPKFYFFDTGVLRALQQKLTLLIKPRTYEYGQYFETWLINEVKRISDYQRKDLKLSFLRTANDVEVDLVIECPNGKILGVEIKSKEEPLKPDFVSGFHALKQVAPAADCICVSTGSNRRLVEGYQVLPYLEFLDLVVSL